MDGHRDQRCQWVLGPTAAQRAGGRLQRLGHRNPDPHIDGDRNPHADRDTYTDFVGYTYADRHANPDAFANAHGHADGDVDVDQHPDANTDGYAHAHCNRDGYGNRD